MRTAPVGLQGRLKWIVVLVMVFFVYLEVLRLINPSQKVGLFLENAPLIFINWIVIFVCAILAGILWQKRRLPLRWLRIVEGAIFGAVLLEISLGLFFDLFLDHELRQPLAEGDHSLFHYASSWSLPFFALIVAYGTLIPSTWLRCFVFVGLMALPPIVMGLAVGAVEASFTQSFFRSFYLQVVFWMTSAVGIASYGAHRLEAMRAEVLEARQLGQYRLLRRIGHGGMGEVYLAEHSLLRRPCAIKLIRQDHATDEALLTQFEHEVDATATLTHPNTVQVFDYGRATDGTLYYVMEYLPGLNLAQLVQQQGLLDPCRAIHILRQLCGALREAHGIGLIHRDVKPGNVIVCERGGIAEVAKLLDFGVVQRARTGTDRNLLDGFQAGTPAFMSPEQLEGREVDRRSDIYSLGAVAYFLLTGHTPQEKPALGEMLTGGKFLAVAPITRFRSDVPADLQAVIMRCLEKCPQNRFDRIDDLDLALAACQKSS